MSRFSETLGIALICSGSGWPEWGRGGASATTAADGTGAHCCCAASRVVGRARPQPASKQAAVRMRQGRRTVSERSVRRRVGRECGVAANMSDIGDPISLERNPSVQMAQRRVFTVVSVMRVLRIEREVWVLPPERLLTVPRKNQFPTTAAFDVRRPWDAAPVRLRTDLTMRQ